MFLINFDKFNLLPIFLVNNFEKAKAGQVLLILPIITAPKRKTWRKFDLKHKRFAAYYTMFCFVYFIERKRVLFTCNRNTIISTTG